jgi:hypothetical protein
MFEKRAQREIRKIRAVSEESTNRYAQQQAEIDKVAHEAAMVTHLAKHAKDQALAVGAKEKEAK